MFFFFPLGSRTQGWALQNFSFSATFIYTTFRGIFFNAFHGIILFEAQDMCFQK